MLGSKKVTPTSVSFFYSHQFIKFLSAYYKILYQFKLKFSQMSIIPEALDIFLKFLE